MEPSLLLNLKTLFDQNCNSFSNSNISSLKNETFSNTLQPNINLNKEIKSQEINSSLIINTGTDLLKLLAINFKTRLDDNNSQISSNCLKDEEEDTNRSFSLGLGEMNKTVLNENLLPYDEKIFNIINHSKN